MSHRIPGASSGTRRATKSFLVELCRVDRPVPSCIDAPLLETSFYTVSAEEFLLELPFGLRIHYKKGCGVAVERTSAIDDDEVDLYLNGTAAGAVAYLHGYIPLHASAVAHANAVYAFTAASGGGKSTLAAGLAQHDMPLYSDDVLLVRPDGTGIAMCLPGHKRLKLCSDALSMTGLRSLACAGRELPKHIVELPTCSDELPLRQLCLLAPATHCGIESVSGAARFEIVAESFYRRDIGIAVLGRRGFFDAVAALCSRVTVSRFERPLDSLRYWQSVAVAAETIHRFETYGDSYA